MDQETRVLVEKQLKKAIDEHSCKEALEVGFRRGVHWYVFESGFSFYDDVAKIIEQLRAENAELKASLQRQVQP